jgi:POT family proton-dependent oligopeptide transporter
MLVWNYAVMAALAGLGGVAFWFSVRGLDKQEDALNNLSAGRVGKDLDAGLDIEEC